MRSGFWAARVRFNPRQSPFAGYLTACATRMVACGYCCADYRSLVRHAMARTTEEMTRRVAEQIRHAIRIDARVALDLLAEARQLRFGLERRAPERVIRALDPALE